MAKGFVDYVLNHTIDDEKSRSVIFSNVIFLSLPAVYFIFILIDIETYGKPFSDLSWDQFIVPIFIVLCFLCLYLNYLGNTILSRMIFLISWPSFLHIIPIISQNSPNDYYIAFPIGIIFHSVLIQMTISRKKHPLLFWIFIVLNFLMLLYFPDFLMRYDKDGLSDVAGLLFSKYYLLDVILYWLLFNMMVFYILQAVDRSILGLSQGKRIIEEKNYQISNALEQLEKTQESLIQKEKMASIGSLSSGVAHELNNPMNVVHGNLDLLKRRLAEKDIKPGEAIDLLDDADKGLDRIRIILDRIRLLAPEKENIVTINLHEVIDNVLYLHRVYEKNDIKLDYQPTALKIKCNPNKLHRVISSILENALYELQHSPLPKILKIEAEKLKTKIKIKISNNGEKIPEKIVSKIYDPFFTTREQGEGVGLGLYLAYQTIREQNGELKLKQDEDWVHFIIELPGSRIPG